ncbi:MAG: hypothetical protein JF603_06540 [Acidobacteria bacterium]|nr:hypothetical protein [Acidobacteriota bacterium]
MQFRRKTSGVVFVALLALLGLVGTAGASAAPKKATHAKKKAHKKTTKKKATAKKTTAKAKPVSRVINSPTGSTTQSGRPRPANVDPDGTLSVGYAAGASTLDPAARASTGYAAFMYPLYDRLTTIDDNLNVQPMLATGWRFPDRSTMEMTLRTDVTFEDGTKFDAAAVKANIERSKTLPGSGLASQLSGISSVEVVRPDLVRFHLSAGGTELPSIFSSLAGMMISPTVIASKVSLDNGTHGGGSGPYTVASFVPADKVTYKQSKTVLDGKYWDKGAGLLKQMSWQFVATSLQRINAVRSGDLDMAQVTGTDATTAEKYIKDGTVQGFALAVPLTGVALQFRQTRPPFDNVQFRTAMQYAIDKNLFAQGAYQGGCDPDNIFWTPAHWSFSKTADSMYRFDHDKAQQMIKSSGIFNPSFTLGYATIYAPQAQAIQGILGDYGINVKLEQYPSGDTRFREGQMDAIYSAISSVGVDPSGYVKNYYIGSSGLGLYNDADGSVTKALAQASDPTTSQATAKGLYDTIYTKLAAQAVQVDLCHTHQAWIHEGKVANIRDLGFTFNGIPDSRYLYVKK